jgi:hypothetical protein
MHGELNMPCTRFGSTIICTSPFYRLRLLDGRYVFMEWHDYLGPTFWRDRRQTREIEEWWRDALMCRALEWFMRRECAA